HPSSFFSFLLRHHPPSTLFPYTTLFRSRAARPNVDNLGRTGYFFSPTSRTWPFAPNEIQGGIWYAALDVDGAGPVRAGCGPGRRDRKSTRLNSSHVSISYAVFCLKKKRT